MNPLSFLSLPLLFAIVKAAPSATTIETIYETVTRKVVHTVPPSTAAPNTVAASAANITQLPQCSCMVASKCRAESNAEMQSCMATCEENLREFGDQTGSYLECFQENDDIVSEAEECLFEGLGDHCTNGNEIKLIEASNIKKYTGFGYHSEPQKDIKSNSFWRKGQREYGRFQRFFHCTKHCIHKKMNSCVTANGCAISLPKPERFQSMMVQCTKKNHKITLSLLKTCQCLAFQKDVKSLIGTCAVVGNPYFVDNV